MQEELQKVLQDSYDYPEFNNLGWLRASVTEVIEADEAKSVELESALDKVSSTLRSLFLDGFISEKVYQHLNAEVPKNLRRSL